MWCAAQAVHVPHGELWRHEGACGRACVGAQCQHRQAQAAARLAPQWPRADRATCDRCITGPAPVQRVLRITPLDKSLADLDSWRPWHQQPMHAPADEAAPSHGGLMAGANSEQPGNRLPEGKPAGGRRLGPARGEQQPGLFAEA